MNAIRVEEFGPPEVLQCAEVPPLVPGPGQILITIAAIGVNPVDTYIRSGTYARSPEVPYTPGFDGAGTVRQVGSGVTSFAPGDRVYLSGSLSGTYAQEALCDPTQVYRLPDRTTFEEGAALGTPYHTAHYALFARGGARPGETVLIHGATGGVGLAATQIARAAGLTVFGTGSTEAGRVVVQQNGAHQSFDHSQLGYHDSILRATGGAGVNLVLEMLANRNLALDLQMLAPAGRIAIIGSRGPIEINPRDAMARSADLRGVMLMAASPTLRQEIHAALFAALENGSIQPVIARRYPLAEAPAAHHAILSSGLNGKIILLP